MASSIDRDGILEGICAILDRIDEIDIAYVYGSFLNRDDFRDIDIAIHISREMPPYQRFKFSQRIARDLEHGAEPKIDFDVRILNYAPPYFQYEVICKGILMLERDEERRVDYEAHLISEYLDLKYMYDSLDKAFLARA